MKKKVFIFAILVVILAIAAYFMFFNKKSNVSNENEIKDVYKSSSKTFSDSKLIETTDNSEYNKDAKDFTEEDYAFGNLTCNKNTIADIITELGKPAKIWKCSGEGYAGVDYVQYKYTFKKEGLNVYYDFDDTTSSLKAICTEHEKADKEVKEKTARSIGIGDDYKKAISAYPSGENIYAYENNNGVYKILYGVNDFFKVLNEGQTKKDKSFAYMHYKDGKIDGLYYINKGKAISFTIDENEKISDIYINAEINEN